MKLWYRKAAWSSRKARQRLAGMDKDSIKSIAVIRHAALGDMIHTRPFLLELRRAFKNARITISVNASYSRGVPEDLVDRVHVIYRRKTRNQGIREQVKLIKSLGYHDLVFDLADTPRSRMLLALNPAKIKLGYTSYWLIEKLVMDVNIPRSDLVFEADMNLQLLNILGIKTGYPPEYGLDVEDKEVSQPYIVYFPSASVPQRYWNLESVSELISEMSKAYPDYSHYILKGIKEEEKTKSILDNIKDSKNVQPVEIDNLDETIQFIGNARLVVSNDTSIRHLAIATGTPSIGIYFGTALESTPFRYCPMWGNHDAVFEDDGSQPAATKVFESCIKLLKVNS